MKINNCQGDLTGISANTSITAAAADAHARIPWLLRHKRDIVCHARGRDLALGRHLTRGGSPESKARIHGEWNPGHAESQPCWAQDSAGGVRVVAAHASERNGHCHTWGRLLAVLVIYIVTSVIGTPWQSARYSDMRNVSALQRRALQDRSAMTLWCIWRQAPPMCWRAHGCGDLSSRMPRAIRRSMHVSLKPFQLP